MVVGGSYDCGDYKEEKKSPLQQKPAKKSLGIFLGSLNREKVLNSMAVVLYSSL